MYASGNRVTIQDRFYLLPAGPFGSGAFDNLYTPYGTGASSRNNYQLPPYHRLDVGANFYPHKKKRPMGIWNLSLCNAYLRNNPFVVRPVYYYRDGEWIARLEQTILFRFIPSLSYTYKF